MNRIKSPEINTCIYGQLIFDKKDKNNQWGKNSFFNKYCCKTGYSHAELWNWIPLSYTTHKNNSKGIKDLNVWPETIKILEENTGRNFLDISHDNEFFFFFFDTKSKGNKSKNKEAGLHQTKRLLHSKRNTQQNEKQWEKIFASHISDDGLIAKIYKKLI